MSKNFSTAAINYMNSEGAAGELLHNTVAVFYSGSQPATADTAASGTPLVAFTQGSGIITKEVRATAAVDFTSATTNCTVLTVGGTSIIDTSAAALALMTGADTVLAQAVANNINGYRSYPDYRAVIGGGSLNGVTYGSDASIVYIIAPKNSGVALNGLAVACTVGGGSTTINGASADTLGVGANGSTAGITAVNMLSVLFPSTSGAAAKEATAWTGKGGSVNINTALGTTGAAVFTTGTLTAGYCRFYCTPNDPEISGSMTPTTDSSYQFLRLDMAMTDMTVTGGSAVSFDGTQTLDAFTLATGGTAS